MTASSKPHKLIATNTFGLGARPGEIEACQSDPKGWVLSHIDKTVVPIKDPALPSSETAIKAYFKAATERRALRKSGKIDKRDLKPVKPVRRDTRAIYFANLLTRQKQAVLSTTSFAERWVRFWSNHFTVSARTTLLLDIVGAFELEAIRPHVFGKFSELLTATTFHPAMLIYLDNNQSIGPNSPTGRKMGKSYNENLAREILELHTLGIGSGYDIDDIIAFAKTLTGWTVGLKSIAPKAFGKTVFKPIFHEPGPQIIMGQTFSQERDVQAKTVINWLASHETTAHFIAVKLAKHFVSPNPPEKLIDTLTSVFLETEGDLTELAKTLVNSDLAWRENHWQYKTPQEFVISTARALPDSEAWQDLKIAPRLGQPPLKAPSPLGWPAQGEQWINAENLLQRLTWLRDVIETTPNWVNESFITEEALGGHLSASTKAVLSKPEERIDLLRLALMSPEFLRR